MTTFTIGSGSRRQILIGEGLGSNFANFYRDNLLPADSINYAAIHNSATFFFHELQQYTGQVSTLEWTKPGHVKQDDILQFKAIGQNESIKQLLICLLYFDKMRDQLRKLVELRFPAKADRKKQAYLSLKDEFDFASNYISSVINRIKHHAIFFKTYDVFARFDDHTQIFVGFYLCEFTKTGSHPISVDQKYRKCIAFSLPMLGWQLLTMGVRLNQLVSALLLRDTQKPAEAYDGALENYVHTCLTNLASTPLYALDALDDFDFFKHIELEIILNLPRDVDCAFGSISKPWHISRGFAHHGSFENMLFDGVAYRGMLHDSNLTLFGASPPPPSAG